MDGAVGRESDPEQTDWNENTADLTHEESEFRPDGAVLLDLLEGEPILTRQLFDQERVWYAPYLFQNGCDNAAITIPTPIPRKLNPMNSWLNPWRPKIMGKAWKARYRIPRIRAVLGRGLSESLRKPDAEG